MRNGWVFVSGKSSNLTHIHQNLKFNKLQVLLPLLLLQVLDIVGIVGSQLSSFNSIIVGIVDLVRNMCKC
jgi:hypothetical protein